MTTSVLIRIILISELAVAQQTPRAPKAQQKVSTDTTQSKLRYVQSGSGLVAVEPKQPYRPIPANRFHAHETIFEFYLKALNPSQIKWGDEIDRRLAALAQQSVLNPYFRFCALQTVLILVLLLVCWLWWDKMHLIKWIAAECLADAINAKRIADQNALEAIERYNRHIEMCNRVIENQESGLTTGSDAQNWRRELRDLQTQLATERAKSARLETELKARADLQTKMEHQIQQLEQTMRGRQSGANAELVARLQRAEAELSSRKVPRA